MSVIVQRCEQTVNQLVHDLELMVIELAKAREEALEYQETKHALEMLLRKEESNSKLLKQHVESLTTKLGECLKREESMSGVNKVIWGLGVDRVDKLPALVVGLQNENSLLKSKLESLTLSLQEIEKNSNQKQHKINNLLKLI